MSATLVVMDDSELKIRRARLTTQIVYWGTRLKQKIKFADSVRLLATIAICESDYGRFAVARHENSFCYNQSGKFSNKTVHMQWGCDACTSRGAFQIMYPIGLELGLNRAVSPQEFAKDEICLPYVVSLIEKRILANGASTLSEFADAYNSGSHKDRIIPMKYIEKFVEVYDGRVLAYLKESNGGVAYV